MKKLLFICLLLLIGTTAFAQSAVVRRPIITTSAGLYDDILFYWGAESDTIEKSVGDNTPTYNASAALTASQYVVGAKSIGISNISGSSGVTFDVGSGTSAIVDAASGEIGFDFKVTGTMSAAMVVFDIRFDNFNYIQAYVNANGSIYLFWKGTNVQTQAAAVAGTVVVDTWSYLEFHWDSTVPSSLPSGHTLEIRQNGTTIGSSNGTLTAFAGSPTTFKIGNRAGNAYTGFIDQILSGNDPLRDLNAIKTETSF